MFLAALVRLETGGDCSRIGGGGSEECVGGNNSVVKRYPVEQKYSSRNLLTEL